MKRKITTEQVRPQYCIDLDWYQQNGRSFSTLAESRLCPKCRKRLKPTEEKLSGTELLATFRDCCSKTRGFIAREQPVLESAFRLFLSNGNKPLDMEELGRQLSERRGGDTASTSTELLSRLLGNDRYYGLRQVAS